MTLMGTSSLIGTGLVFRREDEAPYSGSLSGECRRAKYSCHRAVVMDERMDEEIGS
jgi:hypothetical protein